MGAPPRPRRPPNQYVYFAALAAILTLLLMLCCYFLYFCVKRVKELSRLPDPAALPVRPTPALPNYPVNQGARDSATALARLCREAPAPGNRGAVHPARTPLATPHSTPQATPRASGPAQDHAPDPAPAVEVDKPPPYSVVTQLPAVR